jgi:hypothetical protein
MYFYFGYGCGEFNVFDKSMLCLDCDFFRNSFRVVFLSDDTGQWT